MSSKEYKKTLLSYFLNLDNSFDVIYKLFKFGVITLAILTETTESQIFDFGPSSFFM